MVVDQRTEADRSADRLFHALADTTRRDILRRVLVEAASVSSIAQRYDMSFAAVQKHVAVLEQAQLVVKHRRGREQIVHGDVVTVRRAAALLGSLEELWRARVDRMSAVLADLDPAGRGTSASPAPHDPPAPVPDPRSGPSTGGTT